MILTLSMALRANFYFKFAKANRPGLGKEAKGGEDAFFASEDLITVADGVGGWNDQGVDPAKYSRKLVANVEKFFKKDKKMYSKNPKQLIVDAARDNNEKGSSTLVVGTIDNEAGKLRFANIGDSGFIILRREKNGFESKLRSEEQQHSFNFPFQIGTGGDNPSKADELTFELKEKDLIVMASDGLFDNLFDQMVIDVANETPNDLQKIAEGLKDKAFNLSIDKTYQSPFAVHAKKNRLNFRGGKNDDISVIVAEVAKKVYDEMSDF